MSLNARSIFKKTDERHMVFLRIVQPGHSISFLKLGIPGFCVVRNDSVDKKRCRRIAVFIKDTVPLKICHDFTSANHELLLLDDLGSF